MDTLNAWPLSRRALFSSFFFFLFLPQFSLLYKYLPRSAPPFKYLPPIPKPQPHTSFVHSSSIAHPRHPILSTPTISVHVSPLGALGNANNAPPHYPICEPASCLYSPPYCSHQHFFFLALYLFQNLTPLNMTFESESNHKLFRKLVSMK